MPITKPTNPGVLIVLRLLVEVSRAYLLNKEVRPEHREGLPAPIRSFQHPAALWRLHAADARSSFPKQLLIPSSVQDRQRAMGSASLHPSYTPFPAALTVGWVERSGTHQIMLEHNSVSATSPHKTRKRFTNPCKFFSNH